MDGQRPGEPADAGRPSKLMKQKRQALRSFHGSPRTEQGCLHWVRQFILHHHRLTKHATCHTVRHSFATVFAAAVPG